MFYHTKVLPLPWARYHSFSSSLDWIVLLQARTFGHRLDFLFFENRLLRIFEIKTFKFFSSEKSDGICAFAGSGTPRVGSYCSPRAPPLRKRAAGRSVSQRERLANSESKNEACDCSAKSVQLNSTGGTQ